MMNAVMLTIRVAEHEVYAQAPGDIALAPGDPVRLDLTRFHVFDRAGARLRTYPDTAGGRN